MLHNYIKVSAHEHSPLSAGKVTPSPGVSRATDVKSDAPLLPNTESARSIVAARAGGGGVGEAARPKGETFVEALGERLHIDDSDATVVIVFPRASPLGPLDDSAIVQDPKGEAAKIFVRQHNSASQASMQEGFESFETGRPITVGRYQKVVRRKLLQLFSRSGFKVSTSVSVDQDEVFAKISMDLDGLVVRELAQRYSYQMPFKPEAYKGVKAVGRFPGEWPMCRGGKPVPAFGPYQREIGGLMADFRPVDEIRLIETQLHSLVSMEQLKKQGVISNFFCAAKHSEVQKLHREWLVQRFPDWMPCSRLKRLSETLGMCAKIVQIPQHGTKSGLVRNYFGEEIAFFFRWFAFYTQMLGVLGAFGVLFSVLRGLGEAMNISTDEEFQLRSSTQITFSAIMVVWATIFNQLFANRMARAQQDWGMKDYESSDLALDRAEYDPKMEGTWKQSAKRALSYHICGTFCLMFIALISWIEGKKKEQLEDRGVHGTLFRDHGSSIVVCMIKVCSFTWGYIAPLLVDMQNHRTHNGFDDALTTILASVKIFVTLWNFIYVAFVKKWSTPTCGDTLEEVAELIWAGGFPLPNATDSAQAVETLRHPSFSYMGRNGLVCAYGCYPVNPMEARVDAATNCSKILQHELLMFFLVHVACTVAFLLIPVIKVKVAVVGEVRKARAMSRVNEKCRPYTWLEFQAKCPPYEYGSWGGSRVEDFLECAIGFALLTCFGIMYPPLAFFAFLANVVEFRLLAYRMVHITCRPMPRGASGIGSWQTVFNGISTVAVVVNVLLIAFVEFPMRSMGLQFQLAFFIAAEHVLLGIRAMIDVVIPDSPQDVHRIEDFNAHFRRTMVKYPQLDVPEEERYEMDYAKADIGLVPGDPVVLNVGGEGVYRSESSSVEEAELSNEDDVWCCGQSGL